MRKAKKTATETVPSGSTSQQVSTINMTMESIEDLDIHTNSEEPRDNSPVETIEVIPTPNYIDDRPATYVPFLLDNNVRYASQHPPLPVDTTVGHASRHLHLRAENSSRHTSRQSSDSRVSGVTHALARPYIVHSNTIDAPFARNTTRKNNDRRQMQHQGVVLF